MHSLDKLLAVLLAQLIAQPVDGFGRTAEQDGDTAAGRLNVRVELVAQQFEAFLALRFKDTISLRQRNVSLSRIDIENKLRLILCLSLSFCSHLDTSLCLVLNGEAFDCNDTDRRRQSEEARYPAAFSLVGRRGHSHYWRHWRRKQLYRIKE